MIALEDQAYQAAKVLIGKALDDSLAQLSSGQGNTGKLRSGNELLQLIEQAAGMLRAGHTLKATSRDAIITIETV